ncbi:MAG: hypothetical protein PHN82_05270 [bacterium]|nr:hypothetical protein [bacterium]
MSPVVRILVGMSGRRRCRAAALVLSLVLLSAPALLPAQYLDIWCVWGGGGSGTGVLVRGPNGTVVLLDLGGGNTWANSCKALMDANGITQIHYTSAGHYDSDHVGGLDNLVDLTGGNSGTGHSPNVGTVYFYDRGGSKRQDNSAIPSDYYNFVTQTARRRTIKVDGTEDIDLGHGAILRWLTVGQADAGTTLHVRRRPDALSTSENDMSATCLITYGGFDFYFGSDAEGNNEAQVANVVSDLGRDVDILHVDHHGSDTFGISSPEFLSAMNPEFAVISVWSNSNGHPRRTTVENLQKVVEQQPQRIIRLHPGDVVRSTWAPENMQFCHTTNGHLKISTDGIYYTVSGNGVNVTNLADEASPPPPPPPPDPRAAFTATPGTVPAGGVMDVEWALNDIAPRVDVYFGAETPAGAFVTMRSDMRFRPGIAPVLTDFNAAGNPSGRFSFTVPLQTDEGEYTLMAVCVDPRQSPMQPSNWVTGLATQTVFVQ